MIARDEALATLAGDEFDVLVIGGGITGAGVALDAASRGYSVGLLERADFAAGTSSRSSKLVHGGLRYLQNFDLGLVREALLERQLLVALAPHLVRPLPLVVPAFEGARPDRLMGVGLNLYDVMSVERGRLRGRRGRRGRAERAAARVGTGTEGENGTGADGGIPAGEGAVAVGVAARGEGSGAERSWAHERHHARSPGRRCSGLLPGARPALGADAAVTSSTTARPTTRVWC